MPHSKDRTVRSNSSVNPARSKLELNLYDENINKNFVTVLHQDPNPGANHCEIIVASNLLSKAFDAAKTKKLSLWTQVLKQVIPMK